MNERVGWDGQPGRRGSLDHLVVQVTMEVTVSQVEMAAMGRDVRWKAGPAWSPWSWWDRRW